MTSTPSSPAEGSSGGWTLTGRHVLGVVVGFFAIVIALNIWFLTLAYRTFPGQVSETPYEDGVAFNRHLATQEAQARLGWEAAAAAGATPMTGFRRIVFPLLAPSLIAGWLFIFLLATRVLSLPVLLSGPSSQTMAVAMFDLWGNGQGPELAALGLIWSLAMTCIAVIFYLVANRGGSLRA